MHQNTWMPEATAHEVNTAEAGRLLGWAGGSGRYPAIGAGADTHREPEDHSSALCDTRILIVDDCTLYRECLANALARLGGAVTPDVAWDSASLGAAVAASRPRIVLLNMATRDCATLLRQAMSFSPHVRVVVLGVSVDDEPGIVACAEAGAAGYHLRTESLEELLVLIQKVAAGESLCSPEVAAILLRALATQRPPVLKELALTGREVQILRMLESGLANRDIADQLCIAVHTVKNHVHSLLTKLGVGSRGQAAALARDILVSQDFPTI